MADDSSQAPTAGPGWYPDPSQVDTQRYWDGSASTEQRAPMRGVSPERPRRPSRNRWLALGAVVVLVVAALVVVLATRTDGSSAGTTTRTAHGSSSTIGTASTLIAYQVPSGSMLPTYAIGTTVKVNVDAFDSSEPAIGDVVVFHPPAGAESASECGVLANKMQPLEMGEPCPQPSEEESNQTFMKRIVAVGGDTLSIEEGHPIVNGVEKKDEPYINPCGGGYECNLPRTITVPPGYFFMLGDNRGESDDSRYWGPVPGSWIVGRVEGQGG